jgi:hypothetical protein
MKPAFYLPSAYDKLRIKPEKNDVESKKARRKTVEI